MNKWRQIESVAHSRWCGAYWQSKGLTVMVTIQWGDEDNFEYCFDGVDEGAILVVSTLGAKAFEKAWLCGFREMCDKLKPEKVICYGKPFQEAYHFTDIIYIPNEGNALRKELARRADEQKELF
jgi:hypothetical protein